jgi:hypothetical protein
MSNLAPQRVKSLALATIALTAAAIPASASAHPFLSGLHTVTTLSSAVPTHGPAKGDGNPYGVAVVPHSIGKLVGGDVLVSNFNDSKNQQGTGSSIVQVSPSGKASVFAVVPRPTATKAVGLTTAIAVLRSGYVIVGSLPAPGGMSSAMTPGALSILNSHGKVSETLSGGDINGPWDMTAVDHGTTATLFVTNVLNGTVAGAGKTVHHGTVVRITLSIVHGHAPAVTSNRVIAKGFAEHTDPNALVVGPTGVGLGKSGVLYVADSVGNRIAAIPSALTRTSALGGGGMTVSSGGALNDPLGVAIAPNGDVLSMNGADGNAIETSPAGHQVLVKQLIANGGGDLFGLAVAPHAAGVYYVDDAGSGAASNSLQFVH